MPVPLHQSETPTSPLIIHGAAYLIFQLQLMALSSFCHSIEQQSKDYEVRRMCKIQVSAPSDGKYPQP
jgi:hypothetical protein